MKKIINVSNIISLISILISTFLFILIIKMDIIPTKYIIIFGIVMYLFDIISIIFTKLNKKAVRIIGYILLSIFSIISIILSYYFISTNKFLDNSFENATNTYKTTYYVVAKNDASYKKIKDIKDQTVNYYNGENNIEKAYQTLSKRVKTKNKEYDNIGSMFQDLKSNSNNLILVSQSSYDLLFNLDTSISKDDYKILYKFNVISKLKINETSSKDIFNIYVGGRDFTNTNMDLNMIITVNTKTNKILLTSIPRDYYIEVAGHNGQKDTLSYMGALGIDTNMKSIENLFDIKIDYYLSIKTNSLVSLVDEVGGINYCSDEEYTTTHSMILNSYDDSKGRKLHVIKGCQHLNGIQTLTVARERLNVYGGDNKRQQNCQDILVDIFEQLKSTNTITNYNNILNSVSNLYETTLPKKLVTSMIKNTLNNKSNWTFENQVVGGDDTKDFVHMTDLKDWVMYPNMETVKQAKEKILQVSNQ